MTPPRRPAVTAAPTKATTATAVAEPVAKGTSALPIPAPPARARPAAPTIRVTVLAQARWPEPDDPPAPPPIAGFIVSSFSPIVAAAAERCLDRAGGRPPAGTAIVIVTALGDVASATNVARSVDGGARVGPLLFFQSVPNAVAGYVAARNGLDGPVVCLSPAGDPMAEGIDAADLLFADGDATAALVVCAEQGPDSAEAVLVAPARPAVAPARPAVAPNRPTVHKGRQRAQGDTP